MSIPKNLKNIVKWMSARRKYNEKRHFLIAKTKACAAAEIYADETVAMATSLVKKLELELSLVRQECAILRHKAQNVAKFASELITAPADTVSRVDAMEARLLNEFKAVRSRLGIPAAKAQTSISPRTVQ